MRHKAERAIRVRISSQIMGVKLLGRRRKKNQKYAEGSQENLEVPHGPRLGLPREHAAQMLKARGDLNEPRLRGDDTEIAIRGQFLGSFSGLLDLLEDLLEIFGITLGCNASLRLAA
jgi:hypothetical protein